MRLIVLLVALLLPDPWIVVTSHHPTNLRGLAVQADCATLAHCAIWASGSNGLLLHSTDAGKTWTEKKIPGSEDLDFRGIALVDDHTLYVISSGEGNASRIFKSSNAGTTWEMQYTDTRKEFFLDGIACATKNVCYALSDPVDGKFLVLKTEDGAHWTELPRDSLPPALPKEGAFAASNSSLLVASEKELYFATGGSAARVFHSGDAGLHWTIAQTPILSGSAPQGIFSLAKVGPLLVAVGGDYEKPANQEKTAAYSEDSGQTWKLVEQLPGGYRSGVVAFAGGFLCVGPNGSNFSRDAKHWVPAGTLPLNAIASQGSVWAVGPDGTVARLDATKILASQKL